MNEVLPLTLLQLRPDLPRLLRWLQASGQPQLRHDMGYALHAAAKACLGDLAPKPFLLDEREAGAPLLVGYVPAAAAGLQRAAQLSSAEPAAAEALGLADLRCRELPGDWRAGERFRFSLRAAPIVRSRARGTGYPEVDAALHPKHAPDDSTPRDAAYGHWLAEQLARDGAAVLESHQLRRFALHQGLRRQARGAGAVRGARGTWLPDAFLQGQLRVQDPAAFHRLLARGVGRHRAFGFGCLLLAPA